MFSQTFILFFTQHDKNILNIFLRLQILFLALRLCAILPVDPQSAVEWSTSLFYISQTTHCEWMHKSKSRLRHFNLILAHFFIRIFVSQDMFRCRLTFWLTKNSVYQTAVIRIFLVDIVVWRWRTFVKLLGWIVKYISKQYLGDLYNAQNQCVLKKSSYKVPKNRLQYFLKIFLFHIIDFGFSSGVSLYSNVFH